jgi:hypothetical protein
VFTWTIFERSFAEKSEKGQHSRVGLVVLLKIFQRHRDFFKLP